MNESRWKETQKSVNPESHGTVGHGDTGTGTRYVLHICGQWAPVDDAYCIYCGEVMGQDVEEEDGNPTSFDPVSGVN
jgi:hypothetical protein